MSSCAAIESLLHVTILYILASAQNNERCERIYPDYTKQRLDYRYQGEWSGICNTGKRQTPIDIDLKNVCFNNKSITPLKFNNFDRPQKLIVQNPGAFVSATLEEGQSKRPSICGGGLDGDHVLHALYFHWPNEHTINKDRADLGIHFVFYSDKYTCLEEAVRQGASRAHVNIGYNIGKNQGSPALDSIARAVKQVAKCTGTVKETSCDGVSLEDLLPDCMSGFYRYDGSITAPDCTEGITWFVLQETGIVGTQQFQTIRDIYNQTGTLVSFSARNTQPLNDRIIYHGRIDNNDEECEDCQIDN